MTGEGSKSIRKAYHPELVVLVIEDHVMFSKEIKHALPQHTVVFARSVEEAKLRYDESLPNITFLDIDLPDGNGFEILDYIRTREPEAYVTVLSGSKIEADVALSRQKGARHYIIKPFTRSRIEEVIEDYMESRENDMKLLMAETQRNRLANMVARISPEISGATQESEM